MRQSIGRTATIGAVIALATMTLAGPAFAATCRNTGSFEHWLAGFKKDALAKGISPQVLAAAGPDLTFDPSVIKKDRGQAVFSQSFLTFSDRMISKNRLIKGEAEMKKHAQLFARIDKDFGVPAPVLTAFWGLESDFGAITGNFRLIRSLATRA
jgi:membrane-bound lytic murein transglycosylase B